MLERLSTKLNVEERERNPYISEEPKSVRERYILVEAIAIVTRLGVWNIYVAEAVRYL